MTVLRKTGNEVTAADLGIGLIGKWPGRSDGHLELLSRPVAQEEVVFLLHPVDDCLVDLVSGDANALGDHDPAKADHGDLGGATADVDNHRAARLVDRQVDSDAGSHRLFDRVGPASTGVIGGLFDGRGALLRLCRKARRR